MKYLTFSLLILLVATWVFMIVKWVGFKKDNTLRLNTTPIDMITPSPEISIPKVASESSVSIATSSSFMVASPSVSVLRY